MTSRKEIVVNYETSIHLFRDNKIYDFKVKLPINNYENSNTVLSIKKILCKFTKKQHRRTNRTYNTEDGLL